MAEWLRSQFAKLSFAGSNPAPISNITETPARELRDEISEVLRNGTGKQWPIMVKDWRYCFKGWTSRNKYIAGREAMRDASVTVPAAPSVSDGLTAPQGLGTMEACCDVSQMLESSHAWQCD